MDLEKQLTEILGKFITDKDLEGKTDKQIWYLKALCENILDPHDWAFYYKDKDESLKIIKSILDIKESKHSDKTNFYLKNKGLIN